MITYLNNEGEEAVNLFALDESILKLEGEGSSLADREKDILNSVRKVITFLIPSFLLVQTQLHTLFTKKVKN